MSTHPRLLSIVVASILAVALALGAINQAGARTSSAAQARSTARAHAASSYLTGIGNESPKMFANPLYQQLHTKIVRYVAPYDTVTRPYSLTQATQFIAGAEAAHEQV